MDHPNIIKVHRFETKGVANVNENVDTKTCYFTMEFTENGDIFDWVSETGAFSEQTARFYFRSIVSSLEYLHFHGLAHRDLKPQNLLLDSNYNLKLADFGFAVDISGENGDGKLNGVLGTRGYMAPEIIPGSSYFGVSVDIFAAGVILFIMKAGHPPFSKANLEDPFFSLLAKNDYPKFWELHGRGKPKIFFSEEFKTLIAFMLHPDAVKRPSLAEIKAHPWFVGECWGVEGVKKELDLKRMKVKKVNDFKFAQDLKTKKMLMRSKTE